MPPSDRLFPRWTASFPPSDLNEGAPASSAPHSSPH